MKPPVGIRAQFPLLAGGAHYLDSAASALMPQEVVAAAQNYDGARRANVARGVYAWAQQATAHYEQARAQVAEVLHTAPAQVAFMGGATAALNAIARGVAQTLSPNDAVLVTAAEHHSNIVPWQLAAKEKQLRLIIAPLNKKSLAVDVNFCRRAMRGGRVRAVAAAHASNVTGAINDISALAQLAKEHNALLAVDGAQFAPHDAPQVDALGADFYAFSGHKCYAPNGIGVLWAKDWQRLPPVFGGGGAVAEVRDDGADFLSPPACYECGTPPISQAIGLAAAMQWAARYIYWGKNFTADILADELRAWLLNDDDIEPCFAQSGARAPIVSFNLKGAHPHDVCQILADDNIAARGGHHCAQPLMRRLNINGCVRVSFAPYNNEDDLRALQKSLTRAKKVLR